jgi:hypothetical protein
MAYNATGMSYFGITTQGGVNFTRGVVTPGDIYSTYNFNAT